MFGLAKSQAPELGWQFAKLGQWIYKFRINGADYGGEISAIGDERIEQFFRFVPKPRTILELGSLEGAHTVQLASHRGVKQVLAIEARETNIRKAEFVQKLLRVKKAKIVQANLETADLASFGKFDAVFCSGLLYHLPEPWKLLEQLPRVAPALFLWTHYANEESANETRHGLRGQIHTEGGPNEPLSGMSAIAFWPTQEALLKMLTESGYASVEVIKNDTTHKNSPAITIAARISQSKRTITR